MKLPDNAINRQIFTNTTGSGKLVWNGYAWDKVKPTSDPTEPTEPSTGTNLKVNTAMNKEEPSGNIDGYNFIFTLSHSPIIGSEHVYLNGLLQKSGEDSDYTFYDDTIYFVDPPIENSKIMCTYLVRTHIEQQNEIVTRISSKVFTTAYEIKENCEMIFLNGLLKHKGPQSDYLIDSNIIRFANDIVDSDILIVSYHSI